jgi:transketolase
MPQSLQHVSELAAQLRVDSIRSTTAAGSGHPTSSMSAADLMAVLMARYLRYDWRQPDHPNNDRLILSKGHAAPVLYAMVRAAGAISEEELLSLRKMGSRLQGHPNPRVLPYVDVATGSLGQGLAVGVGMALNGRYLDKLPYRVWVVLGDSEVAEGSVWEAFDKAAHYRLGNLVAILDVNRLGQRGETDLGWNTAAYAARARAFGWHAIELDGHDLSAIDAAYREALGRPEQPTCLIARTEKGSGVSFLADREGWHGKPLTPDQAKAAIEELGGERHLTIETLKPEDRRPAPGAPAPLTLPTYPLGSQEATRKAYGDALTAVGRHRPEVVCLDAEVSNSTHSEEFQKAIPDRFFEMFIAEQQMVSAAVGLSVLGKKAYASTFATFFTRAFDQIRMAVIGGADLRLCGSHAGVSIGEDGPSQMGLEDLAMIRALLESTVLYPCDANQTAVLVAQMAQIKGLSFLRTTRAKTPVIYPPGETFPVGGSRVLRQSSEDQVTVVAAGITVHESLKAHDRLQSEGIRIRVIDAYSVKPIDTASLRRAAAETGGRVVTVEDHGAEGGLGDAVLEALTGPGAPRCTVVKLAVREMPGSGPPADLLRAAGIDAAAISAAVKAQLGS